MSTISCIDFQRLLDEAVEANGDDAVDKSLLNHAAACSSCRVQLQRHRLLARAVTDWRLQTPRPDLVDAVLARMAFEQAPPRPNESMASRRATAPSKVEIVVRPSPASQGWASVAIAVAVLGVAFWMLRSTTDPRQSSQVVATNAAATRSTAQSNEAATPDDAEVEDLVQHAGSAYLVLANQTADAIVEASRAVTPTRIALLDPESSEGNTTEAPGWDNNLKPIGREFGKALGFLFEAVPTDSSPSI